MISYMCPAMLLLALSQHQALLASKNSSRAHDQSTSNREAEDLYKSHLAATDPEHHDSLMSSTKCGLTASRLPTREGASQRFLSRDRKQLPSTGMRDNLNAKPERNLPFLPQTVVAHVRSTSTPLLANYCCCCCCCLATAPCSLASKILGGPACWVAWSPGAARCLRQDESTSTRIGGWRAAAAAAGSAPAISGWPHRHQALAGPPPFPCHPGSSRSTDDNDKPNAGVSHFLGRRRGQQGGGAASFLWHWFVGRRGSCR